MHPLSIRVFVFRWYIILPTIGFISTAISLYIAFMEAHAYYGLRALMVLGFALAATVSSYLIKTVTWPLRRPIKRPAFLLVRNNRKL
jgi:hypothetical protein